MPASASDPLALRFVAMMLLVYLNMHVFDDYEVWAGVAGWFPDTWSWGYVVNFIRYSAMTALASICFPIILTLFTLFFYADGARRVAARRPVSFQHLRQKRRRKMLKSN